MTAVSAPAYRFVARPGYDDPDAVGFVPDETQRRVIDHTRGPLLVHGGPGTGKTTTLVEAVCARIRDGIDPRHIVVLAFSRQSASELRRRISLRRNASGSEVPVYSFPALAFAILRAAATSRGEPPPQLLKGPEQDLVIRELLSADIARWPEELLPAVGTRAFATQLRDLLLRATERGISAPRLAELGRQHDRPEWVAAAEFMTRYVDVLAMRSMTGGATYDSAEIVPAACDAWRADPGIMARPRHVFVDELQDTDPASWRLLELLAGGGGNLTAFGDADSATFAFRGGDARIMREFPERFTTAEGASAPEVGLTVCHRGAQRPWRASAEIAARLRGGQRRRARYARDDVGDGEVLVTVWGSQTQQAMFVSSQLRQAHLYESVPWSRMAVLVKSATQDLPVIEQTLRQAGVPVRAAAEQPVSTRPIVKHLLAIIQCGLNPKSLDEEAAVALLHSAYGGADAVIERKLRQELRRVAHAADVFRPAGELLVEALTDPSELAVFEEEPWARPARRIADLLACARQASGSAAEVLWAVWERAGLAESLAARAVSRDSRAFSADADLDAMMTLFEWVTDFCDRMPGAGADMFAEHVLRQELPADTLAEHARVDDSVELLTAHAAKGREWDIVVVAGVQEGSWPNLRPRGSLLGAEYLVEVLGSGAAADIDTMSVLLDQERRLFYAACSRARDKLLVCAISDDDEKLPSRFTEELGVEVAQPQQPQRGMDLATLVAELRVTACDPRHPDRDAAIAMLARLAGRVPGADPAAWWGLRRLSDDRALALPGEELRVSPSAVAMMDQCGLRWLLEKHGGDEPSGVSQQLGNLVHAAAETAAALPVDQQETAMSDFIATHAADLPSEAPWTARRDRADLEAMKDNYLTWLRKNDRRFVAAERPFNVDLPSGDTGARLRLSGIVDRVEADIRGDVHVVDLKTGKQVPSHAEAASNTQLAAYQLAAAEGAFGDGGSAGASLVYVRNEHRKTGAAQREQPALGDPASDAARDKVILAAQAMTRQTFQAVHSKECRTCRVKQCCPLSEKGKSVTDDS